MTDRIRIRFIINPFSGVKSKTRLPGIIASELSDAIMDYDISMTEGPGHASALAKEAVELGYDIVVAMGGDGSINEVGTQLIRTSTALGIIPGGSGNGIARSLGIELDTRKAIQRIARYNKVLIDTGKLGDRPFIGIAGIGFDAHISDKFLHRKIRGKLAYGYVMMKEFHRFDAFSYSLDGSAAKEEAFVLAFANTSQYGNNAVIAPLAEFQDGRLEFVCISDVSTRKVPGLMTRLFNKSIDQSAHVQTSGFKEMTISHTANFGHVDGEPFEIAADIKVSIVPESLWVLR